MTSPGPKLTLAASQNKYLSAGDRQMHAVLTITAENLGLGSAGDSGGFGTDETAEVIIVDCSGSMDVPPTKIAAARRATAAAVEALRDGALFAVVEGTHTARMVYPSTPRLAVVNARTKAEAKTIANRLVASGGTAIGQWLTLARELLDRHPFAVRHAILLTDGVNEHESPEELDRVLAACEGHFVCDARGIGSGWEPKELLRITSALRGAAGAVLDVSELESDFRAMVRNAMQKVVPDLRIRVTRSAWANLRFLKQVYPVKSDLTDHSLPIDDRITEFSLGSWGDESRDYHVCLDVDFVDSVVGQDLRAARIDLLARGKALATPALILVCWTDDSAASTWLDPKVSYYTMQEELQQAIIAGCDAYDVGDRDVARVEWSRAVRLAALSRDAEILERLSRLVDIIDPAAGDVVLKENAQRGDLLAVEVGSAFSVRIPDLNAVPEPRDGAGAPERACVCGRFSPLDAFICTKCGRPLMARRSDEPTGGPPV